MLTLNLLPNHFRHEYIFEKKKRFTVFLCIVISLILIAFNALLFSTYLFLTIGEKAARDTIDAQQSTDVVKRLTEIEKEIRTANGKIGTLVNAQGVIVPIAPIVEKTAGLIGSGAYMESLSLDTKTGAVNMTGFAATREAVLAIAQRLSESDFVDPQSIRNPVKNILKEKDIDFTFSFTFVNKNVPQQ